MSAKRLLSGLCLVVAVIINVVCVVSHPTLHTIRSNADLFSFMVAFVVIPAVQFMLGHYSITSWKEDEKLRSIFLALAISWFFFFGAVTDTLIWLGFNLDGVVVYEDAEARGLVHLFALVILPLVAGMLWFKPDQDET